MNRAIFGILAFSLAAASVQGADSLIGRLSASKHFGIEVEEELAAFTVHIYTAEAYSANVASLKQYFIDNEAHKKRVDDLDDERRRLQDSLRGRELAEALGEMQRKTNLLNADRPTSPFARQIMLATLAEAGADFIAFNPNGFSDRTILVPLHRIGKVIVHNGPAKASTDIQPGG